MTVARLKSDLEEAFDDLGFDVARDFGPGEPPIGEHFRNREPGSARHALEGIMVGERHLSKDQRTSHRNLVWALSITGVGVALAVLNFTVIGSAVAPGLLFLGVVPIVVGLVSLPRAHAFQSEIVYVWYGYDPPGWVTAYSDRAMQKQMPTTPQEFDVRVGAGSVVSVDIRGKNVVGRVVRKSVTNSGELDDIPKKMISRLPRDLPLRES